MCFVRSAFHPEIPKNSHSIESTVPSAVVDDDGFLNPNLGVVKLKKYVCIGYFLFLILFAALISGGTTHHRVLHVHVVKE